MNIFETLLLSAALSTDALGIGASCALRGIKTPLRSKLTICLISVAVTAAAVFSGNFIGRFVPSFVGGIAGSGLLALLGIYIIVGAVREGGEREDKQPVKGTLERTAGILRSPASCDADQSSTVEIGEACYIGAALSLDSFAAGIGAGIGGAALLVPIMCGLCQLLFLCIGDMLGRYLRRSERIRQKYFSVLSGLILIVLAAARSIF